MAKVILRKKRDASVHRRHPWIFSNSVHRVEGVEQRGETVQIYSADGASLGAGAWSPASQIRVRIWSFEADATIDADFFRERLMQSLRFREALRRAPAISAYRLVNAESDGLPGIIVDRYGEYLVCQFLSAGAEYWKEEIVRQLTELLPVEGIYERSDGENRAREGLSPVSGVLWGREPPDTVEIQEGKLRYLADLRKGHKTGFYLDQRENRAMIPEFSAGADVLNCFAYTGGFGLWALQGGAGSLTNVDTSADALALARRNIDRNGLDSQRVENISADVFQLLRKFRDADRKFDLIVLDPPKFAGSAGQVKRAARGYKDINLLAMKLLRPGGTLFTFSCSGHIDPPLFQKIVAGAALDAGADVRIIRFLSQGADHPVALPFPEGLYLKGLVCRVG